MDGSRREKRDSSERIQQDTAIKKVLDVTRKAFDERVEKDLKRWNLKHYKTVQDMKKVLQNLVTYYKSFGHSVSPYIDANTNRIHYESDYISNLRGLSKILADYTKMHVQIALKLDNWDESIREGIWSQAKQYEEKFETFFKSTLKQDVINYYQKGIYECNNVIQETFQKFPYQQILNDTYSLNKEMEKIINITEKSKYLLSDGLQDESVREAAFSILEKINHCLDKARYLNRHGSLRNFVEESFSISIEENNSEEEKSSNIAGPSNSFKFVSPGPSLETPQTGSTGRESDRLYFDSEGVGLESNNLPTEHTADSQNLNPSVPRDSQKEAQARRGSSSDDDYYTRKRVRVSHETNEIVIQPILPPDQRPDGSHTQRIPRDMLTAAHQNLTPSVSRDSQGEAQARQKSNPSETTEIPIDPLPEYISTEIESNILTDKADGADKRIPHRSDSTSSTTELFGQFTISEGTPATYELKRVKKKKIEKLMGDAKEWIIGNGYLEILLNDHFFKNKIGDVATKLLNDLKNSFDSNNDKEIKNSWDAIEQSAPENKGVRLLLRQLAGTINEHTDEEDFEDKPKDKPREQIPHHEDQHNWSNSSDKEREKASPSVYEKTLWFDGGILTNQPPVGYDQEQLQEQSPYDVSVETLEGYLGNDTGNLAVNEQYSNQTDKTDLNVRYQENQSNQEIPQSSSSSQAPHTDTNQNHPPRTHWQFRSQNPGRLYEPSDPPPTVPTNPPTKITFKHFDQDTISKVKGTSSKGYEKGRQAWDKRIANNPWASYYRSYLSQELNQRGIIDKSRRGEITKEECEKQTQEINEDWKKMSPEQRYKSTPTNRRKAKESGLI